MPALDPHSQALLDTARAVVPGWVERCVVRLVTAWRGSVDDETLDAARRAGAAAAGDVADRLGRLLALDIDEQRTNPLAVLRSAVVHPTAVLRDAGVPPVVRDEFAERTFPDDVYDLSPATWRDVDESLHDVGIVWGAWKAKVHLDRHRPRSEPDGAAPAGGSAEP